MEKGAYGACLVVGVILLITFLISLIYTEGFGNAIRVSNISFAIIFILIGIAGLSRTAHKEIDATKVLTNGLTSIKINGALYRVTQGYSHLS